MMEAKTMFMGNGCGGTTKTFTDEDKKYRAESDLRVLLDARKIRDDKDRLAAALSIAKERQDELKALDA